MEVKEDVTEIKNKIVCDTFNNIIGSDNLNVEIKDKKMTIWSLDEPQISMLTHTIDNIELDDDIFQIKKKDLGNVLYNPMIIKKYKMDEGKPLRRFEFRSEPKIIGFNSYDLKRIIKTKTLMVTYIVMEVQDNIFRIVSKNKEFGFNSVDSFRRDCEDSFIKMEIENASDDVVCTGVGLEFITNFLKPYLKRHEMDIIIELRHDMPCVFRNDKLNLKYIIAPRRCEDED